MAKNFMKKILSIIIMVLIATSVIAQQESPKAKPIMKLLTESFNSGHYNQISNLFTEKAKSKFPPERTMIFLQQLQSKYGNIKKTKFMSVENTFTTYLTHLDKGQVVIGIAVDSLSTISGFPFACAKAVKGGNLSEEEAENEIRFSEEYRQSIEKIGPLSRADVSLYTPQN